MKMQRIAFVLTVLFSWSTVLAQDERFLAVKDIFVPPFPPAARAVLAEGDVFVAVEIDEKGNVVAAESVSGHPLLRATSKAAAQKWTFAGAKGRHFLTLRFMFRLGNFSVKKESKLIGNYTLSNIEPKYRVIQTVSYSNEQDPR